MISELGVWKIQKDEIYLVDVIPEVVVDRLRLLFLDMTKPHIITAKAANSRKPIYLLPSYIGVQLSMQDFWFYTSKPEAGYWDLSNWKSPNHFFLHCHPASYGVHGSF
jgi:hypothetical protein